ncbi:hypothetical protein GS490_02075 [Rhodococcus hoagii]|nr:hypothetical protein [Prescottella equi]
MSKYAGWIGATILALVGIGLGLVPILGTTPRWIVGLLGLVVLIGVLLTFPWPSSNGPKPILRVGHNQSQTAGEHSRLIQNRDGDIHIEGGMGDSKS